MAILQLSPVKIGQAGVKPSSYKMLSSDNLTTVTSAGYIKQGTGGQFFNKNDLVECVYSYGTSSATNIELYVSISNGIITLNAEVSGGLGQAAFKAVSNNALPSVASVNGATVVGNLAEFADNTGTVQDTGLALTNVQNKSNIIAQQAAVGGSGVTYNIPVTGCTTASVASADLNVSEAGAGTGASVIQVLTGAGFIEVTLSADPLAGSSISYIVFLDPQ